VPSFHNYRDKTAFLSEEVSGVGDWGRGANRTHRQVGYFRAAVRAGHTAFAAMSCSDKVVRICFGMIFGYFIAVRTELKRPPASGGLGI